MRTKSFLTFMLAVVTAICFTSCADDNDEGWRAVSAADYKVFTDAKAAFLNNPQNVGTPMYETLIYLTEKPQAVKAQEVEGGTNYEFYFSTCNVSIAKGILDEVGYIVNTSIHNDATIQKEIDAPTSFIQDDATRQGRHKTMVSTAGFAVSRRGVGTVYPVALFFDLSGQAFVRGASVAYAEFNQPGWARSAKK